MVPREGRRPESEERAGDRIRTDDVQLGKLGRSPRRKAKKFSYGQSLREKVDFARCREGSRDFACIHSTASPRQYKTVQNGTRPKRREEMGVKCVVIDNPNGNCSMGHRELRMNGGAATRTGRLITAMGSCLRPPVRPHNGPSEKAPRADYVGRDGTRSTKPLIARNVNVRKQLSAVDLRAFKVHPRRSDASITWASRASNGPWQPWQRPEWVGRPRAVGAHELAVAPHLVLLRGQVGLLTSARPSRSPRRRRSCPPSRLG
jgi:hypothetical protein